MERERVRLLWIICLFGYPTATVLLARAYTHTCVCESEYLLLLKTI